MIIYIYKMEEIESDVALFKQSTNYNEYMRSYMKNHYSKNKDKVRKYRNSLNYKKKNNIPNDVAERYGVFLYNAMKILELLDDMPNEIVDKVMLDYANKTIPPFLPLQDSQSN